MYNTYIASTVFSPGTKGYLSFSYNDCSAFLNDRFDRFPLLVSAPSSSSHCCSCCCSNCCSNGCCSASSSPSSSFAAGPHRLLYGLRQSSLIQWSPWRRPILVGLGGTGEKRVYCRVPGYEFNQGCYEVSCSFKGRSDGVERIERRRNERFRSLNSSHRRCLGGVDEVDAVISLLSEDYLGGGEERVGTERRENYGREFHSGRRREKTELGLGKGDSKYESESVKGQVRGGGCNRRKKERKEREEKEQGEEKEAVSRSENHRATESSSSFSSYYSLASAEDYESDKGAEDDYVVVVDDSSIRHRKDSRSEEDIFDGQVVECRGKGDDVERDGRLPGRRTTATRTGIGLDLKKKSEKKLAEIEEAQSRTESSQMHSRMERVHEIDSKKASSSYKHIDDEEEKSNLAVDLEKGMRKHHRQMGQQFEVRRNYRKTADLQEVHGRNVRTTSQDQKHFSGREENQKVATDFVWERKKDKRSSQQLTEISEIENVNSERVFNLQRNSESRMKILEEDRASTSVQETFLQHQQRAQRVGGQIESRRSAQHSTEISKIDDSSSQRISNLQPDGTNKQQESTSVVYSSSKETTEQRSQTDQMYIQSRKSSQDLTNISVNVTNVSVVHPGNVETASSSRQTSGMRMVDQGDELIPVVKPIKETRERKSPTFESATQVKSQNEGHKAIKVPSFHERTSQEASGSETSFQMISQAPMQQINVNEVDKRNTEMVMMAPSPQLIARGSVRVDPTGRMTMPYDSAENSGGGSGALYTNAGGRNPASHQESYGRERSGEIYEELHPGDALGSAHLSEESSMQFVGEFVDRARHELSTSEAQEEVTASDVELLHEGEKLRKKSLGQHGSEYTKLKGLDSRKSSGGSGTKGPSDEMWHVTEPAVQEPPETETLEDKHETRNLVVKRTGRSLWGIMVDIVRLRWGSRPEIPNSAARSGGKSSSNDSASSEAWFSGHDPDENSEENAKRERRSVSKEAASFHQPQLGRAPSQAWSEASDTYGSKDKIGQLDKDMPSPSIAPKSGSKSKGTSTPADDEDIGLIQGGKHSEAAPFHQPQLGHTSSQVQSKTSDTNGSKDKIKHLDTDSPSPSIALESGSTSKRISTAEDESITLIQGKIASSSTEVGEISLPLYSGGIHSHIIEGSSIGKTDAFGRGLMEPIEQPVVPESSEVQGSEEKNIELRQRKLQRNKQVTRDRFEEWEEAHIRETEQRKIDEMFMREALIEAKKAANTWEVPVGAVLVQHGKIIARGCNLVEELRDSTAHAEMICIREASNKLRSWRLAETTLYVTLEPCPMCAGAILQARIDTVVWGAPNKLLGADGSWIRLFPDGEVGGNGSESTDKPAAPIHPFHPKMTIRRGILASECADTMQQFFQLRRRKKDKIVDQPPQSSSLAFPHHQSKILKKMHDIFHVMFCL